MAKPKTIAKIMLNPMSKITNQRKCKLHELPLASNDVAQISNMVDEGRLHMNDVERLIIYMFDGTLCPSCKKSILSHKFPIGQCL